MRKEVRGRRCQRGGVRKEGLGKREEMSGRGGGEKRGVREKGGFREGRDLNTNPGRIFRIRIRRYDTHLSDPDP